MTRVTSGKSMPRADTSLLKRTTPVLRRNSSAAEVRADWLRREWISSTFMPMPPALAGPKSVAM
jgi:hypothetical protein